MLGIRHGTSVKIPCIRCMLTVDNFKKVLLSLLAGVKHTEEA